MPSSAAAVNKANKATATQLGESLSTELNGFKYVRLSIKASSELSVAERGRVWNIFESNMRTLYTSSSFGWDPRSKQEEMFHPLARFVLCERCDESESQIIAYTILRFEREAKCDVVYCYELQVTDQYQGLGIGKLLTGTLSDIGSRWGMKKIMLTVFKANSAALAFYKSLGFDLDPNSPGLAEEDGWQDEDELDCDYNILSKPIP